MSDMLADDPQGGTTQEDKARSAKGGALRNAFQKLRQHLSAARGAVNLTDACTPFLDQRDCLDRNGLQQALQAIGVNLTFQEGDALFRHISHGKTQGDRLARITSSAGIEVSELCWHYYRQDGGSDEQDVGDSDVRHLIGVEQRCSPRFEAYYRRQQVVLPAEWEAFIRTLREPLPMCLRVNASKPLHRPIIDHLNSFGKLQPSVWYPLAFSCSDAEFHADNDMKTWIRQQHRAGLLTFQELVSMVPSIFLQARPQDSILDMCAAPGSKSLHCLDIMMTGSQGYVPGLVVANDVEYKKCTYILPARAKRAHSPCLVITMCNAGRFPAFLTGGGQFYFDRILCDVPCSGDGTLRKVPAGWHTWSPSLGIALHHKQLQILLQGICRLAVGGRLVYSTCALDPIQNEAVVAAALLKCNGSVKLGTPLEISGLRWAPGLASWAVPDSREGGCRAFFETWEEVPAEMRHPQGPLRSTMFPLSTEVKDELKHCCRFLPHHNNSGGFFVAIFERTCRMVDTRVTFSPGGACDANSEGIHSETASVAEESLLGASNRGMDWRSIHRWRALQPTSDVWACLCQFYGLHTCEAENQQLMLLPREGSGSLALPLDQFIVRHSDQTEVSPVRQVVLLSQSASTLFRSTVTRPGAIQFITGGLRLFEVFNSNFLKQSACRLRPCQEGVRLLWAYATRRCLQLPLPLFQQLLAGQEVPVSSLGSLEGLVDPMEPEKVLVGGLLVALADEMHLNPADRLFAAAMLTTNAIQVLAEQSERNGMLECLNLHISASADPIHAANNATCAAMNGGADATQLSS